MDGLNFGTHGAGANKSLVPGGTLACPHVRRNTSTVALSTVRNHCAPAGCRAPYSQRKIGPQPFKKRQSKLTDDMAFRPAWVGCGGSGCSSSSLLRGVSVPRGSRVREMEYYAETADGCDSTGEVSTL